MIQQKYNLIDRVNYRADTNDLHTNDCKKLIYITKLVMIQQKYNQTGDDTTKI